MTARTEKAPDTIKPLTPREAEVFRLMAAGLTNDSIATELEFGVDAAKIHVRHIFGKLGAGNRTHAVSIGFTTGLLDIEDIKALSAALGTEVLATTPETDPQED